MSIIPYMSLSFSIQVLCRDVSLFVVGLNIYMVPRYPGKLIISACFFCFVWQDQ